MFEREVMVDTMVRQPCRRADNAANGERRQDASGLCGSPARKVIADTAGVKMTWLGVLLRLGSRTSTLCSADIAQDVAVAVARLSKVKLPVTTPAAPNRFRQQLADVSSAVVEASFVASKWNTSTVAAPAFFE
jgi:hypothetical protein